jgi:hypothetical protein
MWITRAGTNRDIHSSRHTELAMRLAQRRHAHRHQVRPAAVSTAEIERLLHWVAAEVRAEQRFSWYAARFPARFIARSAPSAN